MSAVVQQKAQKPKLADGVYRAVVAAVETDGVQSRFDSRSDLVRIGLDLVEEMDGQQPRLWLVSPPNLQGRLKSLVESALGREITSEEAQGFELEQIMNKDVDVVVAETRTKEGFSYSRIITFLPVVEK